MINTDNYIFDLSPRDVGDVGELLFRLMTFRSHGDHAPRPGKETLDGLRIVADSRHTLGPSSQKRYSIRAEATVRLAETCFMHALNIHLAS
jgi:hypothetical protein